MKNIFIILLLAVAAVSSMRINRLGKFRRHHHERADNLARIPRRSARPATQQELQNGLTKLQKELALKRICNPQTCNKCFKLLSDQSASSKNRQHCQVVILAKSCCPAHRALWRKNF